MFSVIVLFHQGENFLRFCIESLLKTTGVDVEIIILMNNADERQMDVRFDSERVRIVKIAESLGHARAANAGAQAANGDYLIFADHDLVFTPGWFEALRATHFRSPVIGATSCRVLNPHTLRVLDFGIGFTRLNSPHPHLDQPRNSPLAEKDREVQAACTGGLLIERRLFEHMGGFDADLGNFYTDIDLCLRLKDENRQCWVAAGAEIYHFGGDFSQVSRRYKASFLKSDVKAWFRAKNDSRIAVDMERYYEQSWAQFQTHPMGIADEYVVCSLMNVVDPHWYIDLMRERIRLVDPAILPTGNRDSGEESLYENLGYDFMTLRVPIAYFVDRFVCLGNNGLWWENRADRRDIVVDRNGNIMHVADL